MPDKPILRLHFPSGLDEERFLREYWQRKPLLLPGAIAADQACPLSAEELAGLACEPEIESRMVLEQGEHGPWEARTGPFSEDDFAALPASHWTLLVQDLDKHIPEFGTLLDAFRFIPDWRLDDIMASYAVDQGSVGPHIDDYDVFLLQAAGQRRWRINTRQNSEEEYIPGLDLRILPDFQAEQEWLLNPGDILYLPPKVAHWGIAEGDGCITCSVGFQAPGLTEMTAAWCDELIHSQVPPGRYQDPGLPLQADHGEIGDWSLRRMEALLDRFLQQPALPRRRWFGRFVTETKPHLQIDPPADLLTPGQFQERLREQPLLERHPWAKMAFMRGPEQHYLYACGDEFPLAAAHLELLRLLTRQRHFTARALAPWLSDSGCLQLLTDLYNHGYLWFADE